MNLLHEKARARGHHCPQFGGGGGSSSSSNQTTTVNTDKRLAVGDGGAGISGDNSSIVITDGGIVSRALDTVDIANATNGDSFQKLLDASKDLFDRGEGLIGQTQKSVADAYAAANDNKAQTIDNRTIIVLAVAAAAAYAYTQGKK
jgi:hypothetical protein